MSPDDKGTGLVAHLEDARVCNFLETQVGGVYHLLVTVALPERTASSSGEREDRWLELGTVAVQGGGT